MPIYTSKRKISRYNDIQFIFANPVFWQTFFFIKAFTGFKSILKVSFYHKYIKKIGLPSKKDFEVLEKFSRTQKIPWDF